MPQQITTSQQGDAATTDPSTTIGLSSTGDASIRPFEFHASDAELADLQRRIAATRWPERETVADPSQGVQLATMQDARALLGDRLRLAQGARRS